MNMVRYYKDDALEWALHYGRLEAVKELVEEGADIHTNDDEALRLASFDGHLEIVKYLISKGADIHVNDDYALRYASRNGHLDVVKYLISNFDPKYVIDKFPKYAEYIADPNYSHARMMGKYGMFT